ncbi:MULTISPECIES: GAF and ANTAR domain-containing protein [Actinomadura]|uniref:GAF and ANTAR domain-containing protein n=1 Tax=Actinomadura yumaensis TaxID=111807 RepID=A0ABW2CK87_9ACTN|nr:GAF and ANTAR domain-containing protein [Actinomadura sp. J1-007]MWK37050.1 GAF domain-containing protein [Actinomadura sp. J1-007]
MPIDTAALDASLDRLRKSPHETDVARALRRIVDSVHELLGYDGAGIMLIDEHERLLYVAASNEAGRSLEQAQANAEQGPCHDTYVQGRMVSTKDVRADARWPQLAAVLDERVRAVAGAPILLGGSPVGTLNVFRSEPGEWDDADVAALRAYADLAGELVTAALSSQEHSVTAAQLQYALDYRVVIERAIGYLMATHRIDAVSAFNRLRRQARDSRRRVADLAAEILDGTAP